MNKKALIVDDSRLACKVMSKMLDTFEIQSDEVYSAEEALDYLKHQQPDVIFLDHTMQGMDGLTMIRKIKANKQTASIPVMMHTAKEGESYKKQAISFGASAVLPKGFDKAQLLKVLDKFKLLSHVNHIEMIKPQSSALDKKIEINTNELPKGQSARQRFWQRLIHPYFERQKEQLLQELDYKLNLQTRKLTREMHLTLEHFEHALVLRMESHSEYVSSTEGLARRSNQKWFIGLSVYRCSFY